MGSRVRVPPRSPSLKPPIENVQLFAQIGQPAFKVGHFFVPRLVIHLPSCAMPSRADLLGGHFIDVDLDFAQVLVARESPRFAARCSPPARAGSDIACAGRGWCSPQSGFVAPLAHLVAEPVRSERLAKRRYQDRCRCRSPASQLSSPWCPNQLDRDPFAAGASGLSAVGNWSRSPFSMKRGPIRTASDFRTPRFR